MRCKVVGHVCRDPIRTQRASHLGDDPLGRRHEPRPAEWLKLPVKQCDDCAMQKALAWRRWLS
eukprot:scaffold76843_cov30-Tisochrysis_lutea.AAC.1